MSETKYTNKEIVSYIVGSKINAAIYQSIIKTKEETDFVSLDELAYAVASDTIRFLVNAGLIEIKETVNNDTNT